MAERNKGASDDQTLQCVLSDADFSASVLPGPGHLWATPGEVSLVVARTATTVNSSTLLFRYPVNPLISRLLAIECGRRTLGGSVLNSVTM